MKLTPKMINLISLMMESAEQILDDQTDRDSHKVIQNWYKKIQSGDDLFIINREPTGERFRKIGRR